MREKVSLEEIETPFIMSHWDVLSKLDFINLYKLNLKESVESQIIRWKNSLDFVPQTREGFVSLRWEKKQY
jgi:hypothetical protein